MRVFILLGIMLILEDMFVPLNWLRFSVALTDGVLLFYVIREIVRKVK